MRLDRALVLFLLCLLWQVAPRGIAQEVLGPDVGAGSVLQADARLDFSGRLEAGLVLVSQEVQIRLRFDTKPNGAVSLEGEPAMPRVAGSLVLPCLELGAFQPRGLLAFLGTPTKAFSPSGGSALFKGAKPAWRFLYPDPRLTSTLRGIVVGKGGLWALGIEKGRATSLVETTAALPSGSPLDASDESDLSEGSATGDGAGYLWSRPLLACGGVALFHEGQSQYLAAMALWGSRWKPFSEESWRLQKPAMPDERFFSWGVQAGARGPSSWSTASFGASYGELDRPGTAFSLEAGFQGRGFGLEARAGMASGAFSGFDGGASPSLGAALDSWIALAAGSRASLSLHASAPGLGLLADNEVPLVSRRAEFKVDCEGSGMGLKVDKAKGKTTFQASFGLDAEGKSLFATRLSRRGEAGPASFRTWFEAQRSRAKAEAPGWFLALDLSLGSHEKTGSPITIGSKVHIELPLASGAPVQLDAGFDLSLLVEGGARLELHAVVPPISLALAGQGGNAIPMSFGLSWRRSFEFGPCRGGNSPR